MQSLPDYPYLSIFRDLDPESLKHLSIRHYKPKSAIVSAYTLSDINLFLLLEGLCVVNSLGLTSDLWCSTPYYVIPGEFFGLIEIISPTPMKRQATIIAKTPVTLLSIDGKELLRWQTARPRLYNAIISQIIQKHYLNRDKLTHFSASSSDAAGAQYLSYLYRIYRKACHDPDYTGPVRIWETHQEIGNAIVKNVRSVDRMISSFKKDGLVCVSRGKLYIDADQAKRLSAYGL